ncbi:hypothetical protein DIPPA_32373 [Diplonema papillatum]|nr:hypothetical protein DIPPA_32373 [Diplonema papillatum]|eukprot:gene8972-13892_t
MHNSALLVLTTAGLPVAANAASGVSIFELGQEIDVRPWQVFAMYLLVIIVSVFYELLTHHIDHKVTSNSGKAIVSHIYKEVMILGGISLLLTIIENAGGEQLFEAVFFHYVHFVIFFMAITLIVMVTALFLFIDRSWARWAFFESMVDEVETDPRLDLDAKHAMLKQFVKRFPAGRRMLACMLFFRSNLPSSFRRVSFTRYMKKRQRKELLSFLDLHANAWAALAIFIFCVAIQAQCIESWIGHTSSSSPPDRNGTAADDPFPPFAPPLDETAAATPARSFPFLSARRSDPAGPPAWPFSAASTSPPAESDDASQRKAPTGGRRRAAGVLQHEDDPVECTAVVTDPGTCPGVVCSECCGCEARAGDDDAAGMGHSDEFELTVMCAFILIEGFGPLGVIFICYMKVRWSYMRFSDNIDSMRKEKRLRPIDPQHYYFWRGEPKFTMTILQVMMLCLVFYCATIIMNLAARLWALEGGFPLLLAAIFPPGVVFVFLIPQLMPQFTILKSVGDMLDVSTLVDVQLSDENSGKFRRIQKRHAQALAPPPFFEEDCSPLDDVVDTLIKLENESKKKAGGSRPSFVSIDEESGQELALLTDFGDTSASPSPTAAARRRRPHLICEECQSNPVAKTCGICGMLCQQCNVDYHKLTKNASHLVVTVSCDYAPDHDFIMSASLN